MLGIRITSKRGHNHLKSQGVRWDEKWNGPVLPCIFITHLYVTAKYTKYFLCMPTVKDSDVPCIDDRRIRFFFSHLIHFWQRRNSELFFLSQAFRCSWLQIFIWQNLSVAADLNSLILGTLKLKRKHCHQKIPRSNKTAKALLCSTPLYHAGKTVAV